MISVLLPVFNAAPFLKECLNSLLAQTEQDWEVIAVNDFSTDSSLEILRDYGRLDGRIRVFENREKGIIPALRLGFSKSLGTYITRTDADDIAPPRKLACLKNALLAKGEHTLSVGLVEYFLSSAPDHAQRQSPRLGYLQYQNWLNTLTALENNWTGIYKECPIPSPCWMVLREDLIGCGGFEPNTYPEDYDLAFRFYKARLKVAGVREVLHLWRDHAERTSRTDSKYSDNRFLELKLSYFLELDRSPGMPLAIWGAGEKGKWIGKQLSDRRIPFHWLTNNPKKIGHTIYGVRLESPAILEIPDGICRQVIVAVSSPGEQEALKNELAKLALVTAFFFC